MITTLKNRNQATSKATHTLNVTFDYVWDWNDKMFDDGIVFREFLENEWGKGRIFAIHDQYDDFPQIGGLLHAKFLIKNFTNNSLVFSVRYGTHRAWEFVQDTNFEYFKENNCYVLYIKDFTILRVLYDTTDKKVINC